MNPIFKTLAIGAAAIGAMAATPASARTYVGVNFGFGGYPAYGGYGYGPAYGYGYAPPYWGPSPVYWGPPAYSYGYYPRYRHGWRHGRHWGHRGWGHRGWRGRHW